EGSRLPTGTVTYLFTDIEGSTALLRQLGDDYSTLIEAHHAIIRSAISRGGGAEVDTAGDGFFAVFPSAVSAVAGAVGAQRELAAHSWPDNAIVRVRMGLHTGEATLVGDRYLGIDVHRGARIAAAGHGGQILVSSSTARLVGGRQNFSLVDLGRHRLKDFPSDDHIYQVAADGLMERFPPLRSLDAARTNLLDKASSFIGRAQEVTEVAQLLRSHRLVTLTGPGGTGKTRLAIQIGRNLIPEYADGVWMVALAPVRTDEAVAQACLDALGLHEQPGRSLEETFIEYLAPGTSLVVLDNCEHVLAAASLLAVMLLQRCPKLSLLVTSRGHLRVPGERVFTVPPLGLPPSTATSVGDLEKFDSFRLFVERAAAAAGGLTLDPATAADVARLVRWLDGVPLALELAAARVGSMSPGQIADRLDRNVELLKDPGSAGEARHRTMTAAVDWSHSLLSPGEQKVFRRLAAFRGPFELDAAEYVAADDEASSIEVIDIMSGLVDRSLVVADRNVGGYRYRMLEVIRQYANSRLIESGEEDVVRDRHARWFLKEVGPALWPVNPNPNWYAAQMTDYHNLETAHDRLVANGAPAEALTMSVALGWFWYNEGYWAEGRTRIAQALALSDGPEPLTGLRSQALVVAAMLSFRQGDYEESLQLTDQAEQLATGGFPTLVAAAKTFRALDLIGAEQLNEAASVATEVLAYTRTSETPWFTGAVLIGVGRVATARGELAESVAMHSEAVGLMEASEDPWGLATAWEGLGIAQLYLRDTEGAADSFERSLASNPLAYDKASIATALLGACRLGTGDDDEAALRLIEEGAAVIFRRRDWVGRAFLSAGVIPALVKHGHLDKARAIIEQELVIARSSADLRGRCRSLGSAARFYARAGEDLRACGLARELLEIRVKLGDPRQLSLALLVVGEVLVAQGMVNPAARLWGAAEKIYNDLEGERPPVDRNFANELREKLVLRMEASDRNREIRAGEHLDVQGAVRAAEASLAAEATARS
ncbi:MAG: ATP-binding protein, partial [Acidimicrobiia bacterium]